jgi:hypothetical protein
MKNISAKSNTCVDGHNDLAILVRYFYGNKIYSKEFTEPFENGGLKGHVDLPRLKQGKAGGAFWSAYVGCPKDGADFSDENYAQGQLKKFHIWSDSQICILSLHFLAGSIS